MNTKQNTLKILNNLENEQKFAKEIIEIVGEYFCTDIKLNTNKHSVSIPRYICVYLIREHTKKITFDYLGKLFNRKHSGLIISVNKLKDSIPYDRNLRSDLKKLNALITLSDGYGNSVAKNNLMYDTINLLNDLKPTQIEQFYSIFSNYKLNNLQVDSEVVN